MVNGTSLTDNLKFNYPNETLLNGKREISHVNFIFPFNVRYI